MAAITVCNVWSAGRSEAVRASAVGQRGRQPRAWPAARHLHPTGIWSTEAIK